MRGEGFVGILGDRKPRTVHRRAAVLALHEAKKLILSGAYQLVVLDEAISCLEQKLLTPAALIGVLDARNKSARGRQVHVLMTGHSRYPEILSRCDLVTEMKMVKHPYYKGTPAVKGIDY